MKLEIKEIDGAPVTGIPDSSRTVRIDLLSWSGPVQWLYGALVVKSVSKCVLLTVINDWDFHKTLVCLYHNVPELLFYGLKVGAQVLFITPPMKIL